MYLSTLKDASSKSFFPEKPIQGQQLAQSHSQLYHTYFISKPWKWQSPAPQILLLWGCFSGRMILHHCSLFCARDNLAAPCSHLRIWYPQFPVRKQYILKQGKTDIFHHKVYSVTESLVLLENDSTQWFPNPASQSKKYLGVSRPLFGGSPRHITSAAIYTST